jgi:hexosaminidase
MVITGWQRYDHFATLCELLPAAVPSMSVTLLAVSKGLLL